MNILKFVRPLSISIFTQGLENFVDACVHVRTMYRKALEKIGI